MPGDPAPPEFTRFVVRNALTEAEWTRVPYLQNGAGGGAIPPGTWLISVPAISGKAQRVEIRFHRFASLPACQRLEASIQKIGFYPIGFVPRRLDPANHSMFVDLQGDRNIRYLQEVEGIPQQGPVHLFPLHEQPGPVRVLFLDDPDHLQLSILLEFSGCFVPAWHVYAAACSPGGKDMQEDLLSPEGGQRKGAAVFPRRQGEVGEPGSDFESTCGLTGSGACHEHSNVEGGNRKENRRILPQPDRPDHNPPLSSLGIANFAPIRSAWGTLMALAIFCISRISVWEVFPQAFAT